MRLKFALVAVVSTCFAAGAQAAPLAPTGYSFDKATDCGTYCYHDAGVFTAAGATMPTTPFGELTDGELGYAGWSVDGAAPWVGWTDSSVNIDFAFNAAYNFSSVSVGTTQDNLFDVVLPNLRVFSSFNGTDWTLRGGLVTPPSSANDRSATSTDPHIFLTIGGLDFDASYVRLEVSNQGSPYGTFSFLDEVRFDGGPVGAVPEPATWAMMIAGFGLAGAHLRRRRQFHQTAG